MAIHRLPFLPENRHYVYTMLCQDGDGPGYVKFGRSGRIGARLSTLRSSCPIPARYFAVVEAGSHLKACALEAALHRLFEGRRIKGEWYRFDFKSQEDKRDFNDGCRAAFLFELGPGHGWTKISVAALDEYNRERRRNFLRSKHRKKIVRRAEFRRRRELAWEELESYGKPK